MEIRIKGNQIRFIYSDDLAGFNKHGKVEVKRASHVEPDENGQWKADMSPVAPGVILGPFSTRGEALQKEVEWLLDNNIPTPVGS